MFNIKNPNNIDTQILEKALTNAGLSWGNVICYGYYGSQAVGLAYEGSDEDVFIICDYKKIPERYARKRHTEINGVDVRIMSYENIRAEFKGMFDVFWLHNFVYTRPDGSTHPYARFVKNTRLSAWECMDTLFRAAVFNTAFLQRKVKEYYDNPDADNRRKVYKTFKRVLKHQMVYLKIEDYILGLSPSYYPAFTSEERDRLIGSTDEGTNLILDHGADPVEVLEGCAPRRELFRDICLSVKYR